MTENPGVRPRRLPAWLMPWLHPRSLLPLAALGAFILCLGWFLMTSSQTAGMALLATMPLLALGGAVLR